MSRSFGSIIREHGVLIAGIALPVLLILLFSLARAVPNMNVPDPQYRAVFAITSYPAQERLNFRIEDQKLQVSYTPGTKDDNVHSGLKNSKLFIFDGANETLKTIKIDIEDFNQKQTLNLKEFENLKLSEEDTAPDGYRFEKAGYRHSSFITEIFSYGSRRIPNALVKGGRVIAANIPSNVYGEVVFIGWVIE